MGIARDKIRWNGWGWAARQDAWAGRDDFWAWLANAMGMPALLATPPRPLEDLRLSPPHLTPARIAPFAAIVGPDRVHQDAYERAFHAGGRSFSDLLRLRAGELSGAPDAVIYPRGEEEVLAIVKLAAQENIAVVPFGGGTGGGVRAGAGMLTLDMSAMDRVLAIDPVCATATAEAGIYGQALERALAAKAVSLGETPSGFEFSSLGGWIAHQGEAASAGRGGWLSALRVATPRGFWDIDEMPPDFKHLMLGSQGMLGVITQARMRLQRISPTLTRAYLFRDFADGCATAREAAQSAIPHHRLRLYDGEETGFLHVLADLEKPHGMRARLQTFALSRRYESGMAALAVHFRDAEPARRFDALARKLGAIALGDETAGALIPHKGLTPYLRDALLDRGVGIESVEISANWSSLAALRAAIRGALDKVLRETAPLPGAHGLVMSHLGRTHAGGAKLTFACLFPRLLDDDMAQARAIRHAAADIVMAAGGTRRPGAQPADQLAAVPGDLGFSAFSAIKTAIDPQGILNPGRQG